MEDPVLFSFNYTQLYSIFSDRMVVPAISWRRNWALLLPETCHEGHHCNVILPVMCFARCLHVRVGGNRGMQKSRVYSGSINDRTHLNAVVSTQVFLWLELMTFILTPISCFLRILVIKPWNEYSSPVYSSKCHYANSEYFNTFFFIICCELRKVLWSKCLPFRQDFTYKAHNDGSCRFWGDVSF